MAAANLAPPHVGISESWSCCRHCGAQVLCSSCPPFRVDLVQTWGHHTNACAVLCNFCITGLSYAGLCPVPLSSEGIKICSLHQVLLHDCSFRLINAFAIAINTTEVWFCWLMPFLSFSVSNFDGIVRTLP